MAKVSGISGDLVRVCSSKAFNRLVWVTFRDFFFLHCFLAQTLMGVGEDCCCHAYDLLFL